MTRPAREAVSLSLATAFGEAVLQALMVTDWSAAAAHALLFAFLVGPPLFLALLAWRRRDSLDRARVLFVVAALVALGGFGALSISYYRFSTDPAFRKSPDMTGVLVPLVQWGAVGIVWLWLVVRERK